MFHGLTLRGLATTLFVMFSYMGITNLLQTGAQIVSTTVSETVGAGQTFASTATADTELTDSIQARLRKRAIAEFSRAAAESSDDVDVTTSDVETAISPLTPETMQKVVVAFWCHLAIAFAGTVCVKIRGFDSHEVGETL